MQVLMTGHRLGEKVVTEIGPPASAITMVPAWVMEEVVTDDDDE